VTSNLLPSHVSEVVKLVLAGKWAEARAKHLRLVPVHDAMFLEANPGPIKAAQAMRGEMSDTVRLPMVAPGEATRKQLAEVLRKLEEAT
jgi:4-hydroxy-tetrahydrodipicolinate synthase